MRHNSARVVQGVRVSSIVLLILVASLGFSGCKSPAFVSTRYDNFTAYYNTFYNARQVFDKGYKNLIKNSEVIDRVHFLPIYQRASGTGSRDFDNAVLKSANLLRNHPDSKWVDDALLLIGKSYFYQENFVGATQKFREVIELNSELKDEAVFWLARSLITSGTLDLAEIELNLGLASENVDKKWSSQYKLLLGEMNIKLSFWELAAENLSSSIKDVKDKQVAGRAQFLLGQVYEQLGQYENAVKAFEAVRKFTPDYELDYAARYSAVRVQGKHVDAEKALAQLKKLERDDKNFSNLAELELLKANIWQVNGRDQEAFDVYDQLLYDPNPIGNAAQLKGRIHYALGELYRDIDRNYVMASAHFDTAAASLQTSTSARSKIKATSYSATQIQYAPEAITDAEQLKTSFSKFAKVFKDIARYDSLLWLGEMSQEEFEAKILEIRKQKAVELAEQRRLLEERQREQAFQTGAPVNDPFANRGVNALPPGKEVLGPNGTDLSVDGYLAHKNPIRVQEGRTAFEDTWGKRPLAPNWRRSAVISNVSTTDDASSQDAERVDVEALEAGELPEVSITEVPRDSTAQADMRGMRANSRYELGNTLFLSMAKPDSAAVWYRTVIEEDSNEPVAQRALYALAEVQRALGDDATATRLYTEILDQFPDSDFSDDVRVRLGLDPVERAETDSTKLAVLAYESAYNSMRDSMFEAALNRYLETAADWDGYLEGGKALMAAGIKAMEWADADSAKIFAALPVTVPSEKMSVLWPDKYGWVEADTSLVTPDIVPTGAPAIMPDPVPVEESAVVPDVVPAIEPTVVPELVTMDSTGVMAQDSTTTIPPIAVMPPPVEVPPTATATHTSAADSSATKTPAIKPAITQTPATNTPTPEYKTVITEAHFKRESLKVEEIFKKIGADFRGKPLGVLAEATRKAIEERRTPPPDTTKVDPKNALAMAGLKEEVPSDSSGTGLATDSLTSVPFDSMAVARPIPTAGAPGNVVAVPTEDRTVDDGATEDQTMDDRFTEDDEPSGVRTTSNIKPLLPTGRPNMDAVGWTVVIGSFITMEQAQESLRIQIGKLAGTQKPLYIMTNAEGERYEFLVAWGLFETKEEVDESVVNYGPFLPPRRSLLHLTSTSDRKQ